MSFDSSNQDHAYTIIKTLHRSRLFVVYLAKHFISQEYVVLKTIDSQFASDPRLNERLENEMRLGIKLNCPHVRKTRGMFSEGNKNYVVYDYIEGKSLSELLENVSISLATDMVLQWLDGILDGIITAHYLGITHGNLNPSNIIISQDGKPYIIGFGKPVQDWMNEDPNQTGIQALMFAAPEVFLGGQPDPAADIYSIGVLAYLILCGKLPWAVDHRHSIHTQKQESLLKPVLDPEFIGRNVPRWLYSVIHKCLRIDPQRRFLSVALLKEALSAKQEIRIEPIQTDTPSADIPETKPAPQTEVPITEQKPEPVPEPKPVPEPEPEPEPYQPEPYKPEPVPPPMHKEDTPATAESKHKQPAETFGYDKKHSPHPGIRKWGMIMGIAILFIIVFSIFKYTVFNGPKRVKNNAIPQQKEEIHTKYIPNQPIKMVFVKGDSIAIGSTRRGAEDNEFPLLGVRVPSFWISPYEITNLQWNMVYPDHKYDQGDEQLPVTDISFLEVLEYCNEKSIMEDLVPCYDFLGGTYICNFSANGYRLPTEAEWEFAAKGHNKNDYFTYSGSDDPDRVGWHKDNSDGNLQPVGQKAPNELGLYDMSGNACEWVWNWYGKYSGQENPYEGPRSGTDRVIRGGSSTHEVSKMRVTSRSHAKQFTNNPFLGFRLVRNGE